MSRNRQRREKGKIRNCELVAEPGVEIRPFVARAAAHSMVVVDLAGQNTMG